VAVDVLVGVAVAVADAVGVSVGVAVRCARIKVVSLAMLFDSSVSLMNRSGSIVTSFAAIVSLAAVMKPVTVTLPSRPGSIGSIAQSSVSPVSVQLPVTEKPVTVNSRGRLSTRPADGATPVPAFLTVTV
jgi:hypothetical protein